MPKLLLFPPILDQKLKTRKNNKFFSTQVRKKNNNRLCYLSQESELRKPAEDRFDVARPRQIGVGSHDGSEIGDGSEVLVGSDENC